MSGVGPRRLVTPAPLSQLITVIILITSGNAFPPDLALLQGLYPASITLISLYYLSCLCLPACVRTPQPPSSTDTLPIALPRGLWPLVVLSQHKPKLLPKSCPHCSSTPPSSGGYQHLEGHQDGWGMKQLAYVETLGKLSFLPWRNELQKGGSKCSVVGHRGEGGPRLPRWCCKRAVGTSCSEGSSS